MRQLARVLVFEDFVDDRLRQPLTDVMLAPYPRRLHSTKAEPRYHSAKIAVWVVDHRAIHRVPTQIGVLHNILGLGAGAEHAVCKPDQRAPMRLEGRDILFEDRAHAADTFCLPVATSRRTGTVSPPIASRVQARP